MNVSGLPSMMIGLFLAVRNVKTHPPIWLNGLALTLILLGILYSVHEFGGIRTWSQGFELGMVTASLAGTYLVARQKLSGYGCYILMHLSCTCLMFTHQSYLLCLRQIASLGFGKTPFFRSLFISHFHTLFDSFVSRTFSCIAFS